MSEEKYPVQTNRPVKRIGKSVTMMAYEVYCHVYSPQIAMVTGECRGGFSNGELIAFLYAHNFPKAEWAKRVDEAYESMELSVY